MLQSPVEFCVSDFGNGSVLNNLAAIVDAVTDHIGESQDVESEFQRNTALTLVESLSRFDERSAPNVLPSSFRISNLWDSDSDFPRLVHALVLVHLGHLHIHIREGARRVHPTHLDIKQSLVAAIAAATCSRDLQESSIVLVAPLDSASHQVNHIHLTGFKDA